MTDTHVLPSLSAEQLLAMYREAQATEKLVQQAVAQRLATTGLPMLTTIVEESDLTYSKSSGWVGTSAQGLPFEVDGEKYTATVTITHTAEAERRKPIFAAAKKFADEKNLKGDERKNFLAAAMTASEPQNVEESVEVS